MDKNDKERFQIDDDYRKWSSLVLNEIQDKPLDGYLNNQEEIDNLFLKYIEPEKYKAKQEALIKEIEDYTKSFTKDDYSHGSRTHSYYEKNVNGIRYSFTDDDSPESIKTMKYVEQNNKRLKEKWDDEIYNYLKTDMPHWLEDDDGNMPSKEQLMKDIKLSSVTANMSSPIVNVWYDDGQNGQFLLGGHCVDFDYVIGDENKKNVNKDYRFEG